MMKYGFIATILLALGACGGANAPGSSQMSPPPAPQAGIASDATRSANNALAARLPLDDQSDFEDVNRGFLAAIKADAIYGANGSIVWNIPQFDFLENPAPDTVNPSLWRQSRLAARHGLFEVADGIWQVRGYDLAVLSIIEGKSGWIIVDPLTTTETASAALALVNDTLGARPVSALIYTHSHADHFGGARGILTEAEIDADSVPVIAPIGFSENAVAENLLAGNHMSRRSTLMFGNTIARSPTAHIGAGLGPALSNGTISLVAPTEEISGHGRVRVIDGVRFEFIDAGGTEAPAEFMFYLPEKRALCTAEVATKTLHNLLTPRGAKVRDALRWSRTIDDVLVEYGARTDVVFASHHWPTWGNENVTDFLTGQRDIYRYIHDQTLRHANAGSTMTEAAEQISEPAIQAAAFDTRDYYGTLNHNTKAVYQFYFGWWGGVPADYHKLPHEVSAGRYVKAMGGADAVLSLGAKAYEDGDYRWAAELFNHAVFADPENKAARDWLAATYEQLGFQAESGAWRSYYLVGANELRNGIPDISRPNFGNADFLRAVTSLDLFDALAARYNPDKMQGEPFSVAFRFPDTGESVTANIGHSVIVPRAGMDETATARIVVDREKFDQLILGQVKFPELVAKGDLAIEGDASAVGAFLLSLDQPEFWFPVVTP